MKIKAFVFGLSLAASSFSFSASDNVTSQVNACQLTCLLYAGSSLEACWKSCEGYTDSAVGTSCTTFTHSSYNQSCMDGVISGCEYASDSSQACVDLRKARCEETVTEQDCG